ncbi:hypothetical protein AB1N83_001586 [Pleurotus pulmonarius]
MNQNTIRSWAPNINKQLPNNGRSSTYIENEIIESFCPSPTTMTSTQLDFESAPGASSPDSAVIAVFNTLQMTGLVLPLAVILTTWLAPTVKRFPAWYNVIISWIISSSSSLLLIGRQTGTKPPFGLCLFQAMLLYVAPVTNACVCLCFALEIFFGVFGAALLWPLFQS